jgi:hypothetical protein
MTPPIGNAVQGAYVVAVVCTGAILGGLAIAFRDLTECLGCLLGGFTLSMWLLTLGPGGLISDNTGKVVFIAAFTLAGFGLYFSRWTRKHGLIACVSFSGATATVIGIDCFSRAGLREFWAYIWALNDGLFPLGVTTYPLTRGIRVELAITILLFVFGIISQLRLWRLIKTRRNRGKEEPDESERDLATEEDNIGRQVEEMASHERREWERVYGNDTMNVHDEPSHSDLGVGGMENDKRDKDRSLVVSNPGSQQSAELPLDTAAHSPSAEIPMAQILTGNGLGDCRVMAEVAGNNRSEDLREDLGENISGRAEVGSDEHVSTAASEARLSSQSAVRLPTSYIGSDPPVSGDDDGMSCAATFADGGDRSPLAAVAENAGNGDGPDIPSRRSGVESLANGVSDNSASLHRTPVHASTVRQRDDINALAEGHEALVPLSRNSRGDIVSILANLDDMSSKGDADTIALSEERNPFESEETLEETGISRRAQKASSTDKLHDLERVIDGDLELLDQGAAASTKSDLTPNGISLQPPSDNIGHATNSTSTSDDERQNLSISGHPSPLNNTVDLPNIISEETLPIPSPPVSLSKENLPPPFSHIALTYRTSEWAKHLNAAEIPEPDSPQSQGYDEAASNAQEQPAPVNVVELQQTAENATPPPAAPRTVSMLPNSAPQNATSRSSPRGIPSASPDMAIHCGSTMAPRHAASKTLVSQSSTVLTEADVENNDGFFRIPSLPPPTEGAWMGQRAGTPARLRHRSSMPTLDDNPPMRSGSPHAKPQTLMGLREALLRNRASATFVRLEANANASHGLAPVGLLSSGEGEADLDNLPLSRRRSLIRQGSLPLQHQAHPATTTTTTTTTLSPSPHPPPFQSRFSSAPVVAAEDKAARQAKLLASFRSSVAADLAGAVNAPSSRGSSSSSIEQQRSILLGQKEAEAQRREQARLEREWRDRAFGERMRRDGGLLMGAHREALRRLQRGAGADM